MTSEPYKGPLVTFNREELARIAVLTGEWMDEPDDDPLDDQIYHKIEVAFSSDPRWRQPTP